VSYPEVPIGMAFDVRNGATPSSGDEQYWDGDIPWVTPADLGGLQSRWISQGVRSITPEGYAACGTQMVPGGSLILSTRAPIGHLAIAKRSMCFNQGCRGLIPRSGINSEFAYWALWARKPQLEAAGQGSTFIELSRDGLRAERIPIPDIALQRAIADFLDGETAKIDALIGTQERLIALLDEKRQATITHAVTKGLDPNAPMKESGVALVGRIPRAWQVVRLRHLAKVQNGIALGRKTESTTTEIPYLRVANVQDGYLDLSEIKTIPVTHEEMRRHTLQAGDVLMNEGGDKDKLGRGAIWRGEVNPCIHQNHVFAVRPHGVESEWLTTITGSHYAKCFFDSRGKQTTNLASISSGNLQELPVIMPPTQERPRILQYLEQKLRGLSALQTKVGATITCLRERRTALITAAVTGEIDVTRPAITEAAE
jgi:type I restriction enzyme, S subunit